MKVSRADLTVDEKDPPSPSLGGLVHGVVNSTASITYAATSLRAGGKLSDFDLEALSRIEQAAAQVADTVKRFAAATPADRTPAPEAGATVDLYAICCEIAEEHRRQRGQAIYCRAFGDARGPWDHGEVVRLIRLMLDSAHKFLGPDTPITVITSGVGRHVRLSMQGLGTLSPEARRACLEIPSQVHPSLGGLMTVTAARGPGSILSMHLPR